MFLFNITLPFQTHFTIKTNCSEIIHLLKLKFGKYITYSSIDCDTTIVVHKEYEEYHITFTSPYHQSHTTTKYPFQTIEDIMYVHRNYDTHIFAIHGAAVEYNGGAYLFVAPTQSGKSTLTSYLISNVFHYLTDDCILLDKSTFTVYPHTMPVHLREGGYRILKNAGVLPNNIIHSTNIFHRYVFEPVNCADSPVPLIRIFFIQYKANNNMTKEMSTTEKIISLLKSPIKEYKMDYEYMSFITRLAHTPMYELYYSDMKYVKEMILNDQ